MRLLGRVFGAAAALRAEAHRRGLLRQARLRGPVLSVGNLAVGGRGKTPVVAHVAALVRDAGLPVAVLSRGYRGAYRGDALVVGDGTRVLATVDESGDEPLMLAQALPGVVVAVGRRRDVVGRCVEERFGPRVHVLDDGFQHLRLHRDLDLVCLDLRDLDDQPLPAGRLRETPRALTRADLVLVTGPDEASTADLEGALGRIGAERTHRVRRRPLGFVDRAGTPAAPPGRVFLFAGIAAPERLGADVAALGLETAGRRFFPDHHAFTAAELAAVEAEARRLGADALVTTAKDAVRLPEAASGLPLLVLRLGLEVSDEARFRERVLAVARRVA
jgi:tetraacyldisaccharide 4'-kinase